MNRKPLRKRLLDSVTEEILPSLDESQNWRIALTEPPFRLPEEVQANFHPGQPLSAKDANPTYPSTGVIRYWPSSKVHIARFPYMGFVLQGEIDWRIGITGEIAEKHKGRYQESVHALLAIPQNTFFIMPTGVPYASGELNHWERSAHEDACYRLFWIRFLPFGVSCHFSHSSPEGLVSETDYYVPNPHLLFAANALTDELRLRGPASREVLQPLIEFIFRRLAHDLHQLQELRPGFIKTPNEIKQNSDMTVELACQYIEGHAHEKLTISDIAANCFVSSGHLCRIFRAEKNMSINEYITEYRLERALSLLRGSTLSIRDIAKSVGYPSNSYFTRLFVKHFQRSPHAFREQHLREYYKKTTNVR